MEQRITIITIGVKDLTISENFYSTLLGWEKTKESNEDIVFYKLNGVLLSLYPKKKLAEEAQIPFKGDEKNNGIGISHNLRSKKEVDQLFEKLKEKNVQIIKMPEKVFWGGYSGYFADPDGTLWEVAYNPYLELDEKGNVK